MKTEKKFAAEVGRTVWTYFKGRLYRRDANEGFFGIPESYGVGRKRSSALSLKLAVHS
jgi:hypothetical protein